MIASHSLHAVAAASQAALAGLRPPLQRRAFQPKQSDSEWAADLVRQLPGQWQKRLLKRYWKTASKDWDGSTWPSSQAAANIELRQTVEGLGKVRIGLDASDSHLCAEADRLALECLRRGEIFHDIDTLHAAMVRIAVAQSIAPPSGRHMTVAGQIGRLTDPLWWRRQLRKLSAKHVEGAAIQLGYVNRSRECYVSDMSVNRRLQQNRRNTKTLENTTATNEAGQTFTLAELAATGPANKSIRRAELMTRINGFERVAIDMGHSGLFLTITCPSHMHKSKTARGGGVMENPLYSGVTPREAQTYLAKKVWVRIRTALSNAGIRIYGFRIAEPNHDGTPHWHVLVFHVPEQRERLKAIILKYALEDSPNEAGAAEHRVDFKPIEAGKGTAAGYMAKYVAKNIDGHKLGADKYGNDAVETAVRVEAWATTWSLRQFQQIGGPPVQVWRELRRVKQLPAGCPQGLIDAWNAVNKTAKIEGRENPCVAWDRYTRAQGGVFCGRKYRIRMLTKTAEGLGRYGESLGERPIGVTTDSIECWTPPHMAHTGGRSERVVSWPCASTRYQWTITKKRREATPWTRVNNCTEPTAQSVTTADPKQIDSPLDAYGRCIGHVHQLLIALRHSPIASGAPH